MRLYSKTTGSGPDLVLIHGWGLNSSIWDSMLSLLEPHCRVSCVDLPGHGRSPWRGAAPLDAVATALCAALPERAVWLGWSLGGLLAMRAAMLHPEKVAALIAVASSPCFIRKPDWQCGMLPQLLETFVSELETDFRRTLDRFLALQVRGSEQATTVLKVLRTAVQQQGPPIAAGLQAGLAMLRDTDLRAQLADIVCPTLLLAGERDTLVPVEALRATLPLLPRAQLEIIAGAGHAPFIAEPVLFAQQVTAFIASQSQDRVDG